MEKVLYEISSVNMVYKSSHWFAMQINGIVSM